ncbi:MAG TPA: class I SAM-dependent methyltransferase [Vicinamibacterales bacterium]|nr:class I SAM-dependent methyltransferase [Vicinamibacterales bacterium]
MKRCLACEGTFDRDDWRCGRCGWRPAESDGFVAFAPDLAQSNDGFSADYFDQLRAVEARHFWFRARNRLLSWTFDSYFPGARSFLEIGCGTGFVLAGMRDRFPDVRLTGSEIFTGGLRIAQQRVPGVTLLQMDARKLPFDAEFDVIGAFDVLEHVDDDQRVLGEMFRSCRPGGGVMLTVPQHQFLWSRMDDYAHHKRRYGRRDLVDKVERAGFQTIRVTSFVSALLPLMLISRWQRNRATADFDPLSEFRIGPLLNGTLEGILAAERLLITAGVSFPAGGSLLLAARKKEAP